MVDHLDEELPDDSFVVAQRIRQMVRWRRVNLLEDLSPFGPFDLVLCRNVLGGLLEPARMRVLGNLTETMAEDGRLVLGAGDVVPGLTAHEQDLGRAADPRAA